MIHLDTSFLIRALVPGSPQDRRLRAWVSAGEPLGMCAVAWAEFLCGPLDPDDAALASVIVGEATPITAATATAAADLFNASGRRRGTFIDCLVAAGAIGAGATLATANPKDFARLPGIAVVE